ncbi:hypothetical protein ACFW1A_34445 [Kitasatospora sp. NPDC058965]|uniref:hypothetical protein n=1 Tax=Kitasatospora sp. NPDC058965 TaxID=3346682 RepID=UPI00368D258C
MLHDDDPQHDDLVDAIRRTGRQLTTGPDTLATAGLARGRALRRRGRTATAAATVAVAVLGAAGLLVGTPGSPSHHADTVLGPPSTGGPSPGATDSPNPSAPPATGQGVTFQQLLAMVKALLPPGTTSQEAGQGTADSGAAPSDAASVTVDFDDGLGKARIQLQMGRVRTEQVGAMVRCQPTDPQQRACTSGAAPGGGTLTVQQLVRSGGTTAWRAVLLDPSGWLVQAEEWNAPAEHPDQPSRSQPPLALDRLSALVTAHQGWASVRDGAAPYPSQPAAPPPVDSQAMLTVLHGLVPAGLSSSAGGAQDQGQGLDGYAYLTVDDGRGASLVQVNVQDWSAMVAADSEMVLTIFGHAKVLPDGTKVAVDRNPLIGGTHGRNLVMWEVNVLRKDGTRVVVTALNSPAIASDAVRPTPALSTDQLTAIATSPLWQLPRTR